MSKLIRITDDILNDAKREFNDLLENGKFSNGEIRFSKSLAEIDKNAHVYISEIAWLKMWTLISEFDKEVAWHGTAFRGENEGEYIIKDILVYPQEVTGATVTTDQQKYEKWLQELDDDTFNNLCFQGHSHVDMGVTPSSVDNHLYDGILQQLDSDRFYIFMIWNKRRQHMVKIYDYRDNVLYEDKDTEISIMDDGSGIERFVRDAKEMVIESDPKSNFTYSNFGGKSSSPQYPWYGNYGNYYDEYDGVDENPINWFGGNEGGNAKTTKSNKETSKTAVQPKTQRSQREKFRQSREN